ncbi:ABC transporter permease subunit [Colwelliaceae bacterium 6471]
MHSFKRIVCLAKFELVRLFLTKRGALALAAFATAWFLILYYLVSSAATIVTSAAFQEMAKQMFGMLGLSQLLKWPVPEMAIYWLLSAYSFPVFALFAASDQTCSDRTRGTLRFISLRASRSEIVIGRFFGQVMIIAILIFVTLLATSGMATYRDSEIFIPALMRSISLFGNLFIVVLPFIAFMSFINSFIRSSRLSLIVCSLFFGLGPLVIGLLEYNIGATTYLDYLLPGVQISDMLGQEKIIWSHFSIPLMQTAFYLVLADLTMKRSAL